MGHPARHFTAAFALAVTVSTVLALSLPRESIATTERTGAVQGQAIREYAPARSPLLALAGMVSRWAPVGANADAPSDATITANVTAPSRQARVQRGRGAGLTELLRSPITAEASPHKHAVLIGGGYYPGNNHARYWNDLKVMYWILRSRGYAPENIHVLYTDGKGPDEEMPVEYPSSKAALRTVFTTLAQRMDDDDMLFVMMSTHGGQAGAVGGGGNAGGSEVAAGCKEVLFLWGQQISDTEFAALVNSIPNYGSMAFLMAQCFGGGFIDELAGPNRVLMSASTKDERSWGGKSFNEFTYHFFSAMLGHRPDWSGNRVNADSDGDGNISLLEAFNFARANDRAAETPLYKDSPIGPASWGPMPASGEGALGAKLFL